MTELVSPEIAQLYIQIFGLFEEQENSRFLDMPWTLNAHSGAVSY